MPEIEIDEERSRQRRWELALFTLQGTRERRDQWRRAALFWCAAITVYSTIEKNWPEWVTGLIIVGWFVVEGVLGSLQSRKDREWDKLWMNANVAATRKPRSTKQE